MKMEQGKPSVKSVAASIGGMGIGIYTGASFLVPAAAAAGVWYVGSKFLKPRIPLFLPSIALLAGHLAWMAIGTALVNAWEANFLDIALMVAFLAWLWFRPNLACVIALTIFETLAFIVNVLAISEVAIGAMEHRALALHVILRLAIIGLVWQAYLNSKANDA
jgi:hypothetical protein